MQPQHSRFISAPFEKPRLFVGSEVIKRAADKEVRHSLAVLPDVKIGGVQPQKIIATRPQDKAYGVDDGGFAGVVLARQERSGRAAA